jgi:serine/threonine protein kinase
VDISEYALMASELSVCLREDPNRVVFPLYDNDPDTRIENFSRIHKGQELQRGVCEARLDGDDEKTYILKEVDRPMYEVGDSDIVLRELQNLRAFRGATNIVQLIAAVLSSHPYRSCELAHSQDSPPVLRGILLEYHPNGSMGDSLRSNSGSRPWARWALQVSEALSRLHEEGIAHMDLKPDNVVISEGWDAVLIDVSGEGGYTSEYLSPEMAGIRNALAEPLVSRKCNDIWALGKMFGKMASVSSAAEERELLRQLALAATIKTSTSRISLGEIIRVLAGRDEERIR